MALTTADLDELKKKYALGITSVRLSDGSSTSFADGSDMWERIQKLEAELDSTKKTIGNSQITFSRGY